MLKHFKQKEEEEKNKNKNIYKKKPVFIYCYSNNKENLQKNTEQVILI